MNRDCCSTVYIFKEDKTLLHLHPKFDKYMPAGGHFEINETPAETAKREVMEETGLEIDFIPDENIYIDYPHAKSINRPYLILLENIDKPEIHQHIDFIYLAKPKDSKKPLAPFRYFSMKEIEVLHAEGFVFDDTIQILKKIFSTEKNLLLESV